jgi:hypothetical protein
MQLVEMKEQPGSAGRDLARIPEAGGFILRSRSRSDTIICNNISHAKPDEDTTVDDIDTTSVTSARVPLCLLNHDS